MAQEGPTQVSGPYLKQRLAAILAADAAGYSRLMAVDERATVATLDAARGVFKAQIESNQGRVIDMAGDSVLAVFETAIGAVTAALRIQEDLGAAASAPDSFRMQFRIGVHLGDVMEKPDGTVYGDGVNIAARLEGLAEPGGITVSDAVQGAVRGRVSATFTDQGEQKVKNISLPVRAFRLSALASPQRPLTDVSATVPGFDGRPAVAVLSFQNMSGDPEQEYFADGIAEDILTRLAMWRWLPIIARSSSFAYKNRAVDMKHIGRELGARYVLEGSVRKVGDRVRIRGQLIDTDTGHHVWAERYDRVLADVLELQDEITGAIVAALEPAVGRAEMERTQRRNLASLDAWDLYLRGMWHFYKVTKEDFSRAMDLLRRAAALDPANSQPLTIMAALKQVEVLVAWSENPVETIKEIYRLAQRATALDGLDGLALSMLAVALAFSGQHEAAISAAQRAIELNPSFAQSYYTYGATRWVNGEPQEAIEAIETAIRLSPNDAWLHFWLGTLSAVHYSAQDHESAIKFGKLAVQRNPEYPVGHRSLANALALAGRKDEAREELGRFLELSPKYSTEMARRTVPFRHDDDFLHYMDGLRSIGFDR